jgi:hypothetical protein
MAYLLFSLHPTIKTPTSSRSLATKTPVFVPLTFVFTTTPNNLKSKPLVL